MKTFIPFLILVFGIKTSCAQINGNQKFNESHLLKRWIVLSEYSSPNVKRDTLTFVPYQSPLTNDLHPSLKHSGIRFEKNSVYFQHVWNKCGTDNPPDFYEGTWSLDTLDNDIVIKTTVGKRIDGNYLLHYLSEDKMILVIRKE